MIFSEYLKSKRTLLLIWFIFHGFALFVNVFKIEMDFSKNRVESEGRVTYSYFKFLSTTPGGYDHDKLSSHFWPIVKFYEYDKQTYEEQRYPYKRTEMVITSFNGIFYQYDFSEFIAYSLLPFLLLYFKWSSKTKSKESVKPRDEQLIRIVQDEVDSEIRRNTKYPLPNGVKSFEIANKENQLNCVLFGVEWAKSIMDDNELNLKHLKDNCGEIPEYIALSNKIASISLSYIKIVLSNWLGDSQIGIPSKIRLAYDLGHSKIALSKIEKLRLSPENFKIFDEVMSDYIKLALKAEDLF